MANRANGRSTDAFMVHQAIPAPHVRHSHPASTSNARPPISNAIGFGQKIPLAFLYPQSQGITLMII
jgi:hypothetical protein